MRKIFIPNIKLLQSQRYTRKKGYYKKTNSFHPTNRRFNSIFKLILLFTLGFCMYYALLFVSGTPLNLSVLGNKNITKNDTIKWVDFEVPYNVLESAMEIDIKTYKDGPHVNWVDLLAYLGSKYGGKFENYKYRDLESGIALIQKKEGIAKLSQDMKYFNYYQRSYGAILNGLLGEYEIQVPNNKATTSEDTEGIVTWQKKYGLKGFSPIANNYWYNDYDDFGAGRSYGYNRKHFGHDLMCATGTPVIAMESGIVETMGWNQYGGWRIGIRSYDKQRYYYYAHLRKDRPYNSDMQVGKPVTAGDVIGYTGQTGYSIKENVNNIDTPHLHIGMQLIFDEKEKDSPNQIWIDMYTITRLLSEHKSEVYPLEKAIPSEYLMGDAKNQKKVDGKIIKKEYYRKFMMKEPSYFQSEQIKNSQNATGKSAISKNVIMPVVSDSNADSIPLPIIMYHGLIKDPKLQNKFMINPKTFENDLKYLKENGYITITMKELLGYVYDNDPLPKKPILLTFDDGYYNNYLYGYPLLKKYDMKAVLAIIGKQTDDYSKVDENNAAYSHVTWPQINEMVSSGTIEIQNHTYNMHTYSGGRQGSKQKQGEDSNAYQQVLIDDVGLLQEKLRENTGHQANTFVYPFGFVSDSSLITLKELGFRASLGCEEGINQITKDPDYLFKLKRFLRPPDISSKDFFEGLN